MRQQILISLALGCLIGICAPIATGNDGSAQGEGETSAKTLHVIPKPASWTFREGSFRLNRDTVICVSAESRDVGVYLKDLIAPATGHDFAIMEQGPADNVIQFELNTKMDDLGKEGYELSVEGNRITLKANAPAGLFYAVQTLRQLLPGEIESEEEVVGTDWDIPAVSIRDRPRFPWRGMHLDVGRHCFPVEFIKRYIDLLALHKMNTFHWHLTEDQGWRIEIKKYPKLTEIGSTRTPRDGEKNYAGYYTQKEVKDIVAYASARFVTVVPEIEMPGHSMAALAAYPELGCTGGPYDVRTAWGVEQNVYCAGNEKTYEFLEDVLNEVLELFPGKYIHIGGDECPKKTWKECPKCQAMKAKHNIEDEHHLQSYFITRMERFINSKGRDIIGWDEILEGGLAPNAAVMSWRGTGGGIAAANASHPVVMSPNTHCYFDYDYTRIPVSKTYGYDPVPNGLDADKYKFILGAQGNVWTERMETEERVLHMAFPRATALAEVVWSEREGRSFEEFASRCSALSSRFPFMKIESP